MTAEVEAGNYSLAELVDLALCSPEVGAVNFNILRILLHEILGKLAIVDQTAVLNDVQAHQIDNFRNYIQGAGTASPMPGVLRYSVGSQGSEVKTPRTARPESIAVSRSQESGPRLSHLQPTIGTVYARQSTASEQEHPSHNIHTYMHTDRETSITSDSGRSNLGPFDAATIETLDNKVARLEQHLEALYALPTSSQILGTGPRGEDQDKHLSVNDMWQIIQLNNRVAAAEAAIQKMANLIEELAGHVRLLKKNDRKSSNIEKEVANITKTSSQMAMELEPCMEKCERTFDKVVQLNDDLEKIKKHLLIEMKKLSQATGVDMATPPYFMQPRQPSLFTGSRGSTQRPLSRGQARGSERGETDSTEFGNEVKFDEMSPSEKQRFYKQHPTPFIPPEIRATNNFGLDGKPLLGEEQLSLLIRIPVTNDPLDPQHESAVAWIDTTGEAIDIAYDENGLPIVFGPTGHRISTEIDLEFDSEGRALFFGPEGQRIFGSRRRSYAKGGVKYRLSKGGTTLEEYAGEDGDRASAEYNFPPLLTDETFGNRGSMETDPGDAEFPHGSHPAEGKISEGHPEARHQALTHVAVDVVSGLPLDELQRRLDPFSDYRYSRTLPDGTVIPGEDGEIPEECRDPAAYVQKQMQEQYKQLQEMQRLLGTEIQDKMESVYQKLLKEIALQHTTTSPYMAVGLNTENCLGPGVCTGFGLPAGTAVVQFPQRQDKVDVCSKGGQVCPGRDVCPGREVCPTCKDDILHNLRVPGDRPQITEEIYPKPGLSSSKENLLRQLTSMTLLPRDLEDLREKLKARGTVPDVFDEGDVLEKLQTLWEAVNIMKTNEENMAVRMVQQDAIIKKIPERAMEKLGQLVESGSLDQLQAGGRFGQGWQSVKDMSGDDAQLIFSNLSSLVLENSAIKEKLHKITDALLEFEQNAVTKPMLMNAMSDKADKGQMNTKVSYDEYGAGMDEFQSRLGNLMQEVYRKNELWKDITDSFGEQLGEKLDKVEIGPIRAYFKNHLGKLEEKVADLSRVMEEPDPAGTRKKLLRDYNCISCDRFTNISGTTNAPTLPILGPILAGHSTASQRALELYRMRQPSGRHDPEGRNLCQIDRQGRGDQYVKLDSAVPLRNDALHLVNRYTGGSHTLMSQQDKVAAIHKRASAAAGRRSVLPQHTAVPAPPQTAYYAEE